MSFCGSAEKRGLCETDGGRGTVSVVQTVHAVKIALGGTPRIRRTKASGKKLLNPRQSWFLFLKKDEKAKKRRR